MSWLTDIFGGKEEKIDPYYYLGGNPEATNIYKGLGSYYSNALASGGFPQYTGKYASDLQAGESENIARQGRMAALGEQGLSPLLKGEYPESYYQNAIYNPLLKNWKQDVLPGIEEKYSGPYGYWGSARAGAVAKSGTDLMDTLAAKRAEIAEGVRRGVPEAITAANALTATSAAVQGIPRAIADANLAGQYKEWVRTRPESAENIRGMLEFLGLNPAEVMPGEESNWGGFGEMAGGGVGAIGGFFLGGPAGAAAGWNIGSNLGRTVGGMADRNTNATGNLSNINPDYLQSVLKALQFNQPATPTYGPLGAESSSWLKNYLAEIR